MGPAGRVRKEGMNTIFTPNGEIQTIQFFSTKQIKLIGYLHYHIWIKKKHFPTSIPY